MMKKIVFVVLGLSLSAGAHAQQNMLGCIDASLRVQAEQIKRDLKPQGFISVRDMMITMKSKESMGIPLVLTKGKLHQLVFIGTREASEMRFELYDKAKFRIDERKYATPSESNVLIYSIMPETTDTFIVALSQSLKTKTACGSFTVLRQEELPQTAPEAKPVKVKPAATKPKTKK